MKFYFEKLCTICYQIMTIRHTTIPSNSTLDIPSILGSLMIKRGNEKRQHICLPKPQHETINMFALSWTNKN